MQQHYTDGFYRKSKKRFNVSIKFDDLLVGKSDFLAQHCRQHLTGYKVPKDIEFRDELPKSNVGKILRRILRDEEIAKRAQH